MSLAIKATNVTDLDAWRSEVAELTEAERSRYDDPQTYADTMDQDATRL
jgi:hypothetical protein